MTGSIHSREVAGQHEGLVEQVVLVIRSGQRAVTGFTDGAEDVVITHRVIESKVFDGLRIVADRNRIRSDLLGRKQRPKSHLRAFRGRDPYSVSNILHANPVGCKEPARS